MTGSPDTSSLVITAVRDPRFKSRLTKLYMLHVSRSGGFRFRRVQFPPLLPHLLCNITARWKHFPTNYPATSIKGSCFMWVLRVKLLRLLPFQSRQEWWVLSPAASIHVGPHSDRCRSRDDWPLTNLSLTCQTTHKLVIIHNKEGG